MKIVGQSTDWQADIINTLMDGVVRYFSIMAGRRSGKTYSAILAMFSLCMAFTGYSIWYIAPVYGQAKEQFERFTSNPSILKFIKKTGLQPYPKITFTNGSTICFRTFERPRNLVGSGLHLVWIDEIQDIPGEHFWTVVRPLVSDKRGKIVISGQHRGLQSWYYKSFFIHGIDAPGTKRLPLYKAWQIPSWRGMVFQSEAGKEELREAKHQVPLAVWEQEYACIPSANQAAVFRPIDIASATKGSWSDRSISGRGYCLGLDLGRVVDPSAFVAIDDTGHICYEELRPLKEKHEVGALQAAQRVRAFGDCSIIVDTTGSAGAAAGKQYDSYAKYYQQQLPNMYGYNLTTDSKKRLIENLALSLEQGAISIAPQCENLLRQLEQYEYKVKASGAIEYTGPGGHDDDLVIACALANEGFRRGWCDNTNSTTLASFV